MKNVAINGFGRIGRAALKVIMETSELDLIAINDLMTIENAAYLLKYDTIYGRYEHEVKIDNDWLYVSSKKIAFCSERDPAKLPWAKLEVDTVIENALFPPGT